MGAGYEPKDREQAKPRTGGGSAPTGKGRGWLDLSGGIADQDRAVTPGPDGMPTQLRPQAQGDEQRDLTNAILACSSIDEAQAYAANIEATVGTLETLLDGMLRADLGDKTASDAFDDARKAHVDAQAFGLIEALGGMVDLAQGLKGITTGLHGLMKVSPKRKDPVRSMLRAGERVGQAIDVAGGYKDTVETLNGADAGPDTVTGMVDALNSKIISASGRLSAVQDSLFKSNLDDMLLKAQLMGAKVRQSAALFQSMRPGSVGHHRVAARLPILIETVGRTEKLLVTRGIALRAIINARKQGDVSGLVRGTLGRAALDKFLASDHGHLTLYVYRRREIDAKKSPPAEANVGVDFILAGLSQAQHEELQSLAASDIDRQLKHHEVVEGLPLREDVGRAMEHVPTLKTVVAGPLLCRIQGKTETVTVPDHEWKARRTALVQQVNQVDDPRLAVKGR